MMTILRGFFLAVLSLVPVLACADPVTATLVVDRETAAAGTRIQVGVYFKLEPGWHIYWKDPGDSGLPTRLSYELPPNFTVSELRWPLHHQFTLPGNIVGNGYENEVLLWSDVSVPGDASGAIPLKIKASWLNCSKDLCIPVRKTFEHSVSIGSAKDSDSAPLFALWKTRLP